MPYFDICMVFKSYCYPPMLLRIFCLILTSVDYKTGFLTCIFAGADFVANPGIPLIKDIFPYSRYNFVIYM